MLIHLNPSHFSKQKTLSIHLWNSALSMGRQQIKEVVRHTLLYDYWLLGRLTRTKSRSWNNWWLCRKVERIMKISSLALTFKTNQVGRVDRFPILIPVLKSLKCQKIQSDIKVKAKSRQMWILLIIQTVSRENRYEWPFTPPAGSLPTARGRQHLLQ